MKLHPQALNVDNFIGGKRVPASCSERIDDFNPATSERLAQIPRSREADVDSAVLAAQDAFDSWSQTDVATRCKWLLKVADGIERHQEEFALLESLDTGKPLDLALKLDISRAISTFRFFAELAPQLRADAFEMPSALNYSHRSPLGVVGLITPWNLPLYLLSWKLAPALAMGNTVVAKPSELTPLTAHRLALLFEELGLPSGIFNLVHGFGPEAGQHLVSHPLVKAISFTGGTDTGAHVARVAAPQFKKLSLELGGKNSTIVFADADPKIVARGILRSSFLNQGQICLCGSRLLIEARQKEPLLKALLEELKSWKIGNPQDTQVQLGSLISKAHREKVESYVEVARAEGGKFLVGGKRPQLGAPFDNGAFFEPTIIEGLPVHSRVSQEEIFGPVIVVHTFETEMEALQEANNVKYGLAASVWTQDLKRAHRMAQNLHVGTVWVNSWLMRDLRVPFGGMKMSGVGREGGQYSLEFFSEVKNICIYLGG